MEGDFQHYFFERRSVKAQKDRFLFNDKCPHLSREEFLSKGLPDATAHETEKKEWLATLSKQFPYWTTQLMDGGFNLCFYGYGSKHDFLLTFAAHLSTLGHAVLDIKGFHPIIAVKDILNLIMDQLPTIKRTTKDVSRDPLAAIAHHLQVCSVEIFLIIHSIDGEALQDTKMQHTIAQLANMSQVHLIVSVDNIHALSLWQPDIYSMLHFCFHETTTFAPYTLELENKEEKIFT